MYDISLYKTTYLLKSQKIPLNLLKISKSSNKYIYNSKLLQDPHLGDIKSWTEYLGWSVMIPSTALQAESQNWRKSKVDQICDDDKDMPGFRYENLNEPSKFGLILIFDVQNYLTGIQVAIPKDLVDENGIYDYETSPYYYNRFYNGEPAYVISLYLGNPFKKIYISKNSNQ